MCFFGGGSSAKEPQPIQEPARSVDPQVQAARADTVRRTKAATGAKSTILTSGGGGSDTMAARRTLAGRGAGTGTVLTVEDNGNVVLGA